MLSDDEKRSMYDQFGEAGLRGEFGGSTGGSQGVSSCYHFLVFCNILLGLVFCTSSCGNKLFGFIES